jgi:hypothetical protein
MAATEIDIRNLPVELPFPQTRQYIAADLILSADNQGVICSML